MGDLFEVLEKQQQQQSRASPAKLPSVNPVALRSACRQYFKEADFSGSGKIDDDEAHDALSKVAYMSGFEVPQTGTVNSVFKTHSTKPGFLSLDEFTQFVTDIATGKLPDAAVAQAAAA